LKNDAENCADCSADLTDPDAKKLTGHDGKPDDRHDCPYCEKTNKLKDTFKCPGCQHQHLCLEHRIKMSGFNKETKTYVTEFYCKKCWKDYGFEMFEE
jgi:DNA-directed RNA polymerase subunit RPC12/RpoP